MPDQPSVSPSSGSFGRVASIDLLRGIVMIIMALDHVRDYFSRSAFLFSPTDLHQTNPLLFFTRWITHFCAPVFVLLAGISAHLYGNGRGRKALSFFLLTRGIFLVLAEIILVSRGWTFDWHFTAYFLGVIWVFGFSMIILSGLIYGGQTVVLTIGLILVAGHNLLDSVHLTGNGWQAFFWSFLHYRRQTTFGPFFVLQSYPLLPWLGILCIGYYLGSLYSPDRAPAERKKILFYLGLWTTTLFVAVRAINGYGDPVPWSIQHNVGFTFLSFLNVSKYPASLLYILMTLGPALLFLSVSERPLNAVTKKIVIYGRVPMFYYLVHIYVLHLLAVIAALLSGFPAAAMVTRQWITDNPRLKGYGFNLATVYLIWLSLVVLMYPLCRWFDGYKRANRGSKRWLSYL